MHIKFHKYLARDRGEKGLMYCFEKNVLNAPQIFTLYEYFSITNVVAHASIMPQSTKRVKNLKFNCDPIGPFSHAPSHIGRDNRQVCIPALYDNIIAMVHVCLVQSIFYWSKN